jgi:hypothetical protein
MKGTYALSLTKRQLEAQAEETPAERLERARKSVRFALRAIADGQPNVEAVCDAERALNGALREMEQLQITLVVLEQRWNPSEMVEITKATDVR